MAWRWKIACVEILFLAGMWNSMTWAHDNSMVEEMLEVLRANGQITHQQYQQLMGKAKVSQPASPSTEKPASPKVTVGYQPGRGFQFESADGKHTLAIGGRIQTRWGYTDRDGGASGQSDESEFRIWSARLWWHGQVFSPALRYFLQTEVLNGGLILLDYRFHYQYQPWLGIQLGQFKPGQARQELLPIGALQFTERSIANDFFNIGRDIGTELIGSLWEQRLSYRLGVFNGNGLNQRQQSTDFLYAGRVQF